MISLPSSYAHHEVVISLDHRPSTLPKQKWMLRPVSAHLKRDNFSPRPLLVAGNSALYPTIYLPTCMPTVTTRENNCFPTVHHMPSTLTIGSNWLRGNYLAIMLTLFACRKWTLKYSITTWCQCSVAGSTRASSSARAPLPKVLPCSIIVLGSSWYDRMVSILALICQRCPFLQTYGQRFDKTNNLRIASAIALRLSRWMYYAHEIAKVKYCW